MGSSSEEDEEVGDDFAFWMYLVARARDFACSLFQGESDAAAGGSA